jgi:hypothetical protein
MKSENKFQPDYSNFRIFQIGFNKCGTRTIYKFFSNNGIPSVHYDGGRIAGSMFRHFHRNKPLIDIRYRKTVYFGDMERVVGEGKPLYVGPELFTYLDREYPNSKFILNTRDQGQWILSRIAHDDGDYLRLCANGLGLSEDQTVRHWRSQWNQFHKDVLSYFRNRPRDLLIFNIDTDGPDKLTRFFQPWLDLSVRHYHHKGKTDKTLHRRALVKEHQLQQDDLVAETRSLLEKITDIYHQAEVVSSKSGDHTNRDNNYVHSLGQAIQQLTIKLQNLTRTGSEISSVSKNI